MQNPVLVRVFCDIFVCVYVCVCTWLPHKACFVVVVLWCHFLVQIYTHVHVFSHKIDVVRRHMMYVQGIGHWEGGEKQRKMKGGYLYRYTCSSPSCTIRTFDTGFVRNNQEMRQLLLATVTMGKTLMEDSLMKKIMVRAKNYFFCTF